MKNDASKLIVALDFNRDGPVKELIRQLDPAYCRVKVGKELFTACGPFIVEYIQRQGFDVFLDLKFHDIPTTVAKAVKSAANLGVWMVNVHCSGGARMLESAAESIATMQRPPKLIGVTVLTSMDKTDLQSIGIEQDPTARVLVLADLAKKSGLDGVVCSAWEAATVKRGAKSSFLAVTPGIRPHATDYGDQRRVMTPVQAIAGGSDFIVVGRPITQASDPLQVCVDIALELESQGEP